LPDYSKNGDEWNEMLVAKHIPGFSDSLTAFDQLEMATEQRSVSNTAESQVPAWLTPCGSERHIGIEQGVRNFAIVAVDKTPNSLLRFVGAELYDLQGEELRVGRFSASDLVLVLQNKTVLMNWMQLSGDPLLLPHVDRVIVHVEQLSVQTQQAVFSGIRSAAAAAW